MISTRSGASRRWNRWLSGVLVALGCAGCAAPMQSVGKTRPPAPPDRPPQIVRDATRPTVGVAFGGGSARGIAHVGVIRWLEEHRIPIDVAAGTSMGGLIGGAFATGMDAGRARRLHRRSRLGPAVRRLDLRLQEHPPQGRRARLSRPARVRPEGRPRRRRPRSTTARTSSCSSGASPPRTTTSTTSTTCRRRSAPSPSTCCRAPAEVIMRQRLARRGDARDDVAAADLPAGRARRPGADRRRHDEQRPGRRRAGDGRRAASSPSTSATWTDREGISYSMSGLAGDTLDAMMRASTRRVDRLGRRHPRRAAGQLRIARLAAERRT